MAGHRADAKLVALDTDVIQLSDQVVDVDEQLGARKAKLHHRQHAVAPS